MKTLIVEDDFICRKMLQTFLTEFGSTDVAVNGVEALAAVSIAIEENDPYNLICLDILMPELDGHEVLKQIRADEEDRGILSSGEVKIIMTTSLKDLKNMSEAFRSLCDGYISKPVDRAVLKETIEKIGLSVG
ncbi:MAG: response regulator [Desulfobacterales bacterium]|nr:response regulator [Desulfobacterales bacterium]MCP4160370.1 response regulator [Deltaproteobacteria bacterium]